MGTWFALAASILATFSVGCSPYGGGTFTCAENTQCGAGGTCSDGFCSFPDPDCDSGLRYGDLSGPLSGQCVGADMPMPDAGDMPDSPPGVVCYGTGLVVACFPQAPTGNQTFSANTFIDTADSMLCEPTSPDIGACVIAAQTITVNAGIFVAGRGAKPLVLVATDSITINGLVSVASLRQFNAIGAAANLPGCNPGTAPTGSSGGAGGSFGGSGGAGHAVGTAGMPGATLSPATLRGGCPGQQGADEVVPIGPGEAGNGGGAVYFIANVSITVASTGAVNASGEGGGGGALSATGGGGGGGSGGLVGFDTPALTISGSVYANGGGGGEASGNSSSGSAGGDPASPTTAAPGGTLGSNFGSDGGAGSAGSKLTGDPGSTTCTGGCTTPTSGGGGGGGAGIIKLYRDNSASGGGQISPPAT